MNKGFYENELKMSCVPKFTNPETYADDKIEILRNDFCLPLTKEDEKFVRSFKTEYSIDGACKALINKYWS